MTAPARRRPAPLRPAIALLLVACGRTPPPTAAPTPKPPSAPAAQAPTHVLPAEQFYMLEVAGPTPPDTSVTVVPGRAHTIVLRHAPPDNAIFAIITLPGDAFDKTAATSVVVKVHPIPGQYGVEVTPSAAMLRPGTLTFTYARFFRAPAGAREKYGSPVAFERVLAIGHHRDDGMVATLVSQRPGPDQLQAPMATAGAYLVVGLR